MSDMLLELGKNPTVRRAVRSLGLPLPLPQSLRRAKGPFQERPLQDRQIVVGIGPGGRFGDAVARTLVKAGANPYVVGGEPALEPFRSLGEAFGRPPRTLDPGVLANGFRAHGLVFDGSGLDAPAGLRAVYEFFHPLVRSLNFCGRVVVIGQPPSEDDPPERAAAQAGLEGFVRTVAKEVGRKGATAHLITAPDDAEDRLESLLRFLLSDHSAFVTGQPFHLSSDIDPPESTPWTRPLQGMVALLTGAARGIGAATAERLFAEGAHVVCLDRPEDAELVGRVARKVSGSALLADVTAGDAPDRIADELNENHGGVDIVVHNAGVTRDRTLARMTAEQWDQALDINLGAVTRINARLMDGVLRENGCVICLSSIAGLAGNVGQANYAASKAGLVGYVKQLSRQLSPHSIAVNAVAPGFIETRLTARVPVMIREAGRRLSSLGQGGLPVDVAELITYLATPGACGLTGQVIRVCGGGFIGA